MDEICAWKNGLWCYQHDLDHFIEENGQPDIIFTWPIQLPYAVMEALMDTIMPSLADKL